MRRMAFAVTTPAIEARAKFVTRRLGWARLRPGDLLRAVDRGRGRAPRSLAILRVVSVRTERLDTISPEDVALEGFPGWTPAQFVAMFCESFGCAPETVVRRIAFDYTDEA